MTLREFVRQNRQEIDAIINAALYRHDGKGGRGSVPSPPPQRNDSEREQWIMNDEGLYSWFRLAKRMHPYHIGTMMR